MSIRKTIAAMITAAMVLSMTACANNGKPNDITENVSGNIKTDYNAMWKILPEIEETPIENLVYEYDVELAGMVVTGYKVQSPKVRIPDKIEGEPVVGVNLPDYTITEIIMPDTVKRAVLNKTCLQYANYPLCLETYEDLFGDMSPNQSYSAPGAANEVFSGSTIKAVYIPNGVKYIPSSAFKNCSALEIINLPSTVTALEEECFRDCKSLMDISFPDGIDYMAASSFSGGKDYENLVVTYKGEKYTYENASKLYELINYRDGLMIKDGVVLDSLKDITKAVIPDTVTKIGDNAFRSRESLNSVIISDTVTEIDIFAFSGCENITVTYKGKTYDYEHIEWLYDAINLGESGMLIENGVLKDVSRELTEVVIPDSITEIDRTAFKDCTNIKVTYTGKTYTYDEIEELYNEINCTVMPNLIGLKKDELKQYSSYWRIKITEDWSEEAEGIVIGQSIATGTLIPKSQVSILEVNFTVSKGVKMEEIDDYTNRPADEASEQLQNQGFEVTIKYESSDVTPKNYVIRTSPLALEKIPVGSEVTIFVSLGSETVHTVLVPKFVGLSLSEAKDLCEEFNLLPIVEFKPDPNNKDVVISQSIIENTNVEEGETITITIGV